MTLVGVDASVRLTGLGFLERREGDRLELSSVETLGRRTDGVMGLANRVAAVVRERAPTGSVISIEVPPPTGKRSTRHGGQAQIGWSIGRLTGMLEVLLGSDYQVRLVAVSDWRAAMLDASTRWGHPASKPRPGRDQAARAPRLTRVERERGSIFLIWACGHRTRARSGSMADLERAAQAGCPECARVTTFDPRDAWKALAVRLAAHHWPSVVRSAVQNARSRARDPGKADHRLSGVADACEAAWIGASGLLEASPEPDPETSQD